MYQQDFNAHELTPNELRGIELRTKSRSMISPLGDALAMLEVRINFRDEWIVLDYSRGNPRLMLRWSERPLTSQKDYLADLSTVPALGRASDRGRFAIAGLIAGGVLLPPAISFLSHLNFPLWMQVCMGIVGMFGGILFGLRRTKRTVRMA